MKRTAPFVLFSIGLVLASAPEFTLFVADAIGPTASVAGRVQNAATGAYLEGAVVTLEPTQQTTLTTRDDSFYFRSVPVGDYRLAISYTGLDSQTVPIAVASNLPVTREISLTSQIYAMEKFTVAGEREGNALAVTQQRNAANLKNVISADTMRVVAANPVELAYNQRFTRLPGAWKGVGVSLNYTKIESQGNYTSSSGTQTGAEIAGFMPETFNASLTYALRAWDVQVKYTYRAQNLRDFNANPLLRVYYYSKKSVDLNLKYKLHPRLTVFADVINIFDDPIANAFIYTNARVRFNQVFTPAIKAGISGRF